MREKIYREMVRGSSKPGALAAGLMMLIAQTGLQGAPASSADLAQQIIEIMTQAPGVQPGRRPLHAKGIVCQGTFSPSAEAAKISRAPHFAAETLLTVRFSDGGA